VRDLLLGREPKDFDIATDALPDEVKDLFRNCRLVGRRFRLAHILFGREVVEVATFRAQASDDEKEGDRQVEDSGRILRDNVYGTLEDDAWRRDFTINALYYNIQDFSVVDYAGGVNDLEAGVLRIIGDAEQRYREDPVRMLRAVRFAARIGFRIDAESEKAIYDLGYLLKDIPPARLFDEVLKLFFGGYALQTFELLRHYNLFEYLFPQTEDGLAEEEEGFPHILVMRALANTDARIAEGKPVTPAFLYAALLWEPVRAERQALLDEGEKEQTVSREAARRVVNEQLISTSLPRRFSTPMQEIWAMQSRLPYRAGKRAFRLLDHPRFRAAYDFMLLCAEAGEADQELCDWWTTFQEVDEDERRKMVRKLTPERTRRGRKPGNKKAAD
jgi:poly(A) polymerase